VVSGKRLFEVTAIENAGRRSFAVLGSPISHSLSPKLHGAAFSERGLPNSYEAFQVESLSEWLPRHSEFAGLSITMPLKEQALALAESLDDAALATDSVNTLIKTPTGWHGANTDVLGLQFALRDRDLSRVVVVGSGATARSALFAMRHAKDLGIIARNPDATRALSERYSARICDLAELESATVISTLPAGALEGFIGAELEPTGLLLDVAYHPWPSASATRWMQRGFAVSGVEMLIGQAVAQQRLFESADFDEVNVLRAMRAALDMKE
jgi:shikimate dehydrogenase